MTNVPLTSRRYEFNDISGAEEHFLEQGWTDGLPIVLPTQERVQRFLDHSGLAPSEILGTEPVKGRVITAEKVAVNAVMAGCKPEYFPVVVAAVEAMCEPEFNFHAVTVSTDGAAVLTIVNGPVTRDLEMNSDVSVFGPGNRANATIGRAIRLVISNVTGAVPGVLDKATLGHPGKYTFCIAEAEEASPWEPLHVERGFALDQSTVTVAAGQSSIPGRNFQSGDEAAAVSALGDIMLAAGHDQTELFVVIAPETVEPMALAGWTKQDAKARLHEAARRPASEWARAGRLAPDAVPEDMSTPVSVAKKLEGISLLVAGGAAGANAAIIPLWGGGSGSRSVTKKVRTG